MELGEFYVKPATIEVPAGTELTLDVTNAGAMDHDLKLAGTTGTGMLGPDESETVELGAIDADAQAWCTVPGHKEAGMVLAVVVTADGSTATSGGPDHGAAAATAAPTGGDSATIDPQAEPPDGWKPYDPTLAPAPGGTEHEVTLHATETVLEVAPGVTQEMWTFNDQVPGPILRGKVGDLFTVTLVNEGKLGHSIDFHASKVAWNDEMRTIEPGRVASSTSSRAEYAGAFMYHCGTAPDAAPHRQRHVRRDHHRPARAGTGRPRVRDGPVRALPRPRGRAGRPHQDAERGLRRRGVQRLLEPVQVRTRSGWRPDERIRVWVVDDGPSENSAFHIVGTIFDTVCKEGTYLLQPDARQGGSQVLDLQPAQGGFVEFTFAEDGFYPMVTHKFANVGKGALGLFQAGDVEMPAGASH